MHQLDWTPRTVIPRFNPSPPHLPENIHIGALGRLTARAWWHHVPSSASIWWNLASCWRVAVREMLTLYMSEVLWRVKTHASGWLSALRSFVVRAVWDIIARSTSPAWDEVPAFSHAWSVVRVSKVDSGYVWTAVTVRLGCVPGKGS